MQGFTQSIGFDHLWLLNECTLVLQTQSKANKPDQGYMAGALAGLSSALPQCKVHPPLALLNLLSLCSTLLYDQCLTNHFTQQSWSAAAASSNQSSSMHSHQSNAKVKQSLTAIQVDT